MRENDFTFSLSVTLTFDL